MLILQIVLLVAGFVCVAWAAIRAYRGTPTVRDNGDGTATLNMQGVDRLGLTLTLTATALSLVSGALGLVPGGS